MALQNGQWFEEDGLSFCLRLASLSLQAACKESILITPMAPFTWAWPGGAEMPCGKRGRVGVKALSFRLRGLKSVVLGELSSAASFSEPLQNFD